MKKIVNVLVDDSSESQNALMGLCLSDDFELIPTKLNINDLDLNAEVLAALAVNHKNDVSVPIYHLQKFLGEWEAMFAKKFPALDHYIYGHFGDGNLHVSALKPGDMSMEEFLRWAVLEVVVKKPLTPGRKPIAFKREAA